MIDRLKKLLSKNNISDSPEELKKYSVAGKFPSLVLFLTSIDQIAEIMKLAKRGGKKILIAGNNSQHYLGAAIEGLDWCISLARMNKIVEHHSADLVVTVEPGVPLPQVQKFLNKHRQYLPLDPIGSDNRTLGGIVATNSSGPLRLLYGTCRDLVLGMKLVLPDGTVIRAGSKTVKNVAGYDLSKLFIGSMGTLGVIAEITFKLYPLPAQSQTLWVDFKQLNEIVGLIQSVCSSNLVISRCEYVNAVLVEKYLDEDYQSKGSHTALLNVQGNKTMVRTTIARLQQMALESGANNIQNFSKKDDAKLWYQIQSVNSSNGKLQKDFHCQVSIPKAVLGTVMGEIEKFSNNNILLSLAVQAHAGNGIINIFWSDPAEREILPDRYRSQIESLRQVAQSCQGNMVVHSIPEKEVTITSHSLKEPELTWGKPGNGFQLMKMIKASYDPHHVLATGRFIGGI
jgi:glycolate oxidase FAD binding subunit